MSYERPARVDALDPQVVVEPKTRLDEYAAPAPTPDPDPLAGPIYGALRAAEPTASFERDERLDVVAEDLAAIPVAVHITRPLMGFLMNAHGIIEPPLGVTVTDTDGADPAQIAANIAPEVDRFSRFGFVALGIGRVGEHVVVVVAHQQRFVMQPVEQWAAAGGAFQLDGTLSAGLDAPAATLTRPDGAIQRVRFVPQNGRYRATLSCSATRGREWVALTARDRLGDEQTLASFPVDCGQRPEPRYRTESVTNLTTLDLAGRLEAILNRDRLAMGLAPLRGDARATRAASLWSLDMLSIARVAHEINGNNSVSRLRDSGLVPAHSRNIAFHADDLQNAVELLENDDAYHDAMFDRSVTHIGVAITPDPLGGFYAAVELVQIPARIDPKAVATRLRSALRHASDKRLRLSDKLDDRAQLYANLLSAGWQADQLPPVSDVRRVVALSPVTIDERDIASVFARQRGSFGLGVTQSAENGAFANRIFVVLLFE